MKSRGSLLAIAVCGLALFGCGSSEGLSAESSKSLHGNVASSVRLTEYADLQCPACKAAHSEIVKPLFEKYGDKVAFEFKHFPIRSIHRYALEAALAAECAADQGKFWEYVDHTYENQADMTMDALLKWGTDIGIADQALFEKCWKSQIKKEAVNADYKEGRDAGVSGTPSFFVNGEKIESDIDALSAALEKAIQTNTQRL